MFFESLPHQIVRRRHPYAVGAERWRAAVGVGLVLLIAATAKDASSQEAIDDRLPG